MLPNALGKDASALRCPHWTESLSFLAWQVHTLETGDFVSSAELLNVLGSIPAGDEGGSGREEGRKNRIASFVAYV